MKKEQEPEQIQERVQKKIQDILDKCPTGDYIFRGENKHYKVVSSGLYREYYQRDDSKPANDDPLIDSEHFSALDMEQDVVETAKQHISPSALNIEVLTELQHYGGKTTLLDFSKDTHIALFFACDGKFDEDGRMIFIKTSELTASTEINYNQIDKTKHILISPTGKSPRVIFQSSIFVHVPKGYLEEKKYKTIKIPRWLKKPLLDYLSKYFNINAETIYNDIQGFIRNQDNYPEAKRAFYEGNANVASDEYSAAIKKYDEAIELNPQGVYAYSNRGAAKAGLGKNGEAIKDYNKAIELNPQFAKAYYNRGNAKSALGKNEEAIEDYNKAINLNPQFALAYCNRGNVNYVLENDRKAIADYTKAIEIDSEYADAYRNRGVANAASRKYEAAIGDYTEAIEIDPKYAKAYGNRGDAKLALDRPEEAIEDFYKAKTLFIKSGNMEMVRRCEEKIADINRLITPQ